MRRGTGFTLIELLVVLGIVALMMSLAVPRTIPRIEGAKETVLSENLRLLRATLEQFHGDTGRYPQSLQQLVERKYLKALPLDPLTGSADSWIEVAPGDGAANGVADVRSAAAGKGRDGRAYAQW